MFFVIAYRIQCNVTRFEHECLDLHAVNLVNSLVLFVFSN